MRLRFGIVWLTGSAGVFAATGPGCGGGVLLGTEELDDAGTSEISSNAAVTVGPGATAFAMACAPNATQCNGNGVQTCGPDGGWGSAWACATGTCAGGVCVGSTTTGASCASGDAGVTHCGATGESCCTSLEIPGGSFFQTFDNPDFTDAGETGPSTALADPAYVSGFRMDKYLVTVGRFRQYVQYLVEGGAPPAEGSGKHAHLNGGLGLANSASPGSYETGWDAATGNAHLPVGATAAAAWNASLACGTPASGSWTSAVEADENLPITCVDWYAASAFCIWDGGFVPSDAEWEYVAVAGSQERPFPWGSQIPWLSPNRVQYAIFDCDYGSNNDNCSGTGAANIAPVGTAILGAGYWGQLDMLGNTEEWTQDWVDDQTPHPDPCNDCGYLSPASTREARGGNFGTPVVWNSGITAFRPTVALDCGALGCLDPRVP